MTRYGTQTLDTLRFANFVAPLDCFICSLGNSHDAERCRHCGAPLELARHAHCEKRRPKLVAALGAESTGKSTYMGVLMELLSQSNSDLQINAHGVFSIGVQHATMRALRCNRFPDPTSQNPADWNWLHCQVQVTRRRFTEVVMPDLSGRSVLGELRDDSSFPVVKSLLNKAVGAVLFIDTAEIMSGRHDQDFFAMEVINFMCRVDGGKHLGWPRRPVAVICSKADEYDESFDDPASFIREYAPNVWELVTSQFTRYRFFATSVAGACAESRDFGRRASVPLRLEPRGVIEPFQWITSQVWNT